jgi:amino acid transporter
MKITPTEYIPKEFAEVSMHFFSPKRSVIIDMVMVQLISAMIVGLLILLFKGGELNASETSMYMIGIFVSFILLTTVYARITR